MLLVEELERISSSPIRTTTTPVLKHNLSVSPARLEKSAKSTAEKQVPATESGLERTTTPPSRFWVDDEAPWPSPTDAEYIDWVNKQRQARNDYSIFVGNKYLRTDPADGSHTDVLLDKFFAPPGYRPAVSPLPSGIPVSWTPRRIMPEAVLTPDYITKLLANLV